MNNIVIPTNKGSFQTNTNDIIRIQSSSNYSKIFFTNQRPLLVAKVLRWFDEVLSTAEFSRVHKSHLINLQHVKNVELTKKTIQMNNGEVIGVSKRKLKNVKELFKCAN